MLRIASHLGPKSTDGECSLLLRVLKPITPFWQDTGTKQIHTLLLQQAGWAYFYNEYEFSEENHGIYSLMQGPWGQASLLKWRFDLLLDAEIRASHCFIMVARFMIYWIPCSFLLAAGGRSLQHTNNDNKNESYLLLFPHSSIKGYKLHGSRESSVLTGANWLGEKKILSDV